MTTKLAALEIGTAFVSYCDNNIAKGSKFTHFLCTQTLFLELSKDPNQKGIFG
jgi:hypothetical protein